MARPVLRDLAGPPGSAFDERKVKEQKGGGYEADSECGPHDQRPRLRTGR